MIPLRIANTGLVTAVGHTTAETLTSIDAGVRRFRATPIRGFDGRALVASLVLPVSPALAGLRRARSIAEPALVECLGKEAGRTALLLNTQTVRPPLAEVFARVIPPVADWSEELLSALADSLARRGVPVVEAVGLREGRSGGVAALERAAILLDSGAVDQCIVGGVDAPGERGALESLDARGEIKSSRVPTAPIPGEAAAFVALKRATRDTSRGSILAAGVDEDLTTVMSASLSAWGGDRRTVRLLAVDLNGDRERAKQMTVATMRTLWGEGAQPEIEHPFDRVGDVHAAAAPLLFALASQRLLEGHVAMVLCGGAPGGRHGAAILGVQSKQGVT